MVGLEVRSGALAGYHQHVQVSSTVALDHVVLGIIDRDAVHYEVVGVDLGLGKVDGDGPYSVLLLHGDGALDPVAGKGHYRGVLGCEAECHLAVGDFRRDDLLASAEIEVGELLG